MGGAAPVPGKGGKKSLDSELNLVPFIDLLSCLITFLLISAVWTQISAQRVHQTGGLSESEPKPDETTIDIRLTVTERGYTLSLAGNAIEVPKSGVGYDTKSLIEKLKLVKQNYPEQRAVTLAAEDSITFDQLTRTVDEILAIELPDINITAAVN